MRRLGVGNNIWPCHLNIQEKLGHLLYTRPREHVCLCVVSQWGNLDLIRFC